MSYRIGVVMDPITQINYKKDTTLALLWAAAERGWDLFYMEMGDLFIDNGTPKAKIRSLQVHQNPDHWFDLGDPADTPLEQLDAILMRKDPPFDSEYIYATYILEAAQTRGTLIVNDPRSLRDCNEKVFATQFPQCCPPLLVSRDPARLRQFHREHQNVVYKPLDGMGGAAIFHCPPEETNLSVIIETLTQHGSHTIMAQRYLPEIKQGDKRILVIDGEAVPYCLARIPASGESRGNLAAGGSGVTRGLTERDRWIVAQVAPELKKRRLFFVGLDVIGDYLTEINVTSPTCAREIDREHNTGIGQRLMDAIAKVLDSRQ
ncbi:MAG: glutathione synthase [Cellvibrionaceae bacterium]